jgi:hypothetical protein
MPFDNGSGTPPMMGRPQMFGSTTPGFPPMPRQDMGTGTLKMPPTAVACTMEARLCPDGRVMARNPMTCEWITSSCGQSVGSATAGQVPVRPTSMPLPVSKPPFGVKTVGTCLAMDVRMCPNGTLMPRDPDCTWRADKCSLKASPQMLDPFTSTVPPTGL